MTTYGVTGRLSAGWLSAVPPRTLSDVITYVIDSFSDLRRLYPALHGFDQTEPSLTLSLCQHADRKPPVGAALPRGGSLLT